jgi:hypothetical protein
VEGGATSLNLSLQSQDVGLMSGIASKTVTARLKSLFWDSLCTAGNGQIEAGIYPAPAIGNPIRLSRHPSVCMRMWLIGILTLEIPKHPAKDQPGCTPPGIPQSFPNTVKNHHGIIARLA